MSGLKGGASRGRRLGILEVSARRVDGKNERKDREPNNPHSNGSLKRTAAAALS